jgi:hypothetical protein
MAAGLAGIRAKIYELLDAATQSEDVTLSSVLRFKDNWFLAAARVLAGALAGALLLFELVAANGELHQALHHGGKAASDSCVLCLFAKGHVDSPEAAPVVTVSIRSSFDAAPRMESIAMVDFTYLASPSRAPPALPLLFSVVA